MSDDRSASLPPLAVLGAGSWGTALALLLARNGHGVSLWGHDAAHLALIQHERVNAAYLKDARFPDNLSTCSDLADLGRRARGFMLVVPSHAYRATLQALKPHLPAGAVLAWATKGMEPGSAELLSAVNAEVMGAAVPAGVISGPTFAREVAQGLPTALTVAADDTGTAETIAEWLRNDRVRVYTSTDVAGVEVGGAVKNVLAIAAGISDGLGFGANARAALITRGLVEMQRLGLALGGRPETFMGLTGVGDLVLTCTDNQSRNRRVGLALGRGQHLREILVELGQEAEGVAAARAVHTLAARHGVEMPIAEQVYRVLFDDLPPQQAVQALLARGARSE